MILKRITSLLILVVISAFSLGQEVAIKTNLLYGIYTSTPNIGAEIGIGRRSTIDVGVGYNPWNLNGDRRDNKKLVHWLGQVEYRYWLCQKFNGSFFGIHGLGSQYNISKHKLPLLFGKESKEYRYEGWAVGAGVSYGYQWLLSNHFNLEASIGAGYARLNYSKYNCIKCGDKIEKESKNYFGPTKATVSLIYLF
ncbi:MAG: DUF3575 domain-containing protein [Marinifilaceae bacterium]